MKPTFISAFCTLLLFQFGVAQNIKGKIIDASTGEAIPYANIKVNACGKSGFEWGGIL